MNVVHAWTTGTYCADAENIDGLASVLATWRSAASATVGFRQEEEELKAWFRLGAAISTAWRDLADLGCDRQVESLVAGFEITSRAAFEFFESARFQIEEADRLAALAT